jgi:anti-anti-sigma regulatory factor
MQTTLTENIPVQVSRGCVVAALQVDLSDDVINQLRTSLLEKIQQARANAVILDLSGLAIIDPDEFEQLIKTLDMARVMGAIPVIAGLKPSIISSLVALDANISGVHGALDLDHAFQYIEEVVRVNQQDQDDDDQEPTEKMDTYALTGEAEQDRHDDDSDKNS